MGYTSSTIIYYITEFFLILCFSCFWHYSNISMLKKSDLVLYCFSPRPQNNGKFCPGSSRLNQLCNTRPCPLSAIDFRAQQCAEYNSKPFRGWYYKWKPYTTVDGKVASCFKTYRSLLCSVHTMLNCLSSQSCQIYNDLQRTHFFMS